MNGSNSSSELYSNPPAPPKLRPADLKIGGSLAHFKFEPAPMACSVEIDDTEELMRKMIEAKLTMMQMDAHDLGWFNKTSGSMEQKCSFDSQTTLPISVVRNQTVAPPTFKIPSKSPILNFMYSKN